MFTTAITCMFLMADSLDLKCWDLVEKYLMLILDGGLRHPPVNPLRATHPYSYLPHKYTKYHRRAPRYQIHITKYQKMNWGQLTRTHIRLTNTQNTTDMLLNINSYLPHKQGPAGRGVWLRDGTGTRIPSGPTHKYTKYHIHVAN